MAPASRELEMGLGGTPAHSVVTHVSRLQTPGGGGTRGVASPSFLYPHAFSVPAGPAPYSGFSVVETAESRAKTQQEKVCVLMFSRFSSWF